jgi:hypothetical protein
MPLIVDAAPNISAAAINDAKNFLFMAISVF